MTVHLCLTSVAWTELLHGLSRNPRRRAVCPFGLAWSDGKVELLVHRVHWFAGEERPRLTVLAADDETALRRTAADANAADALLVLGLGPAAGLATGWFATEQAVRPLASLAVAGPGLPRIALDASPSRQPDRWEQEVWSRSIGALGEASWRRLTDACVTIVGVGRTGSILAHELARLGVRRLILVDPDRVEAGNLGEMSGAGLVDIGRPKVEVVAEALLAQGLVLPAQVETVPTDLLELPGLRAVKAAELVCGCVDNGLARLALAICASFNRPLLDLGTGVRPGGASDRLGADVRLLLPGESCPLCFGGVADAERVASALATGQPPAPEPWRQQRGGSLRSLNQLAVGLGLRLLEELVAGRLAGSTWLQLEYNAAGLPHLQHFRPAQHGDCPICARAAAGDDALTDFRALLRAGLQTGAAGSVALNEGTERDDTPSSLT